MKMKNSLLGILMCTLPLSFAAQATEKDMITFGIHGMTCQFCAFGLQKTLAQIDSVERVQISIQQKKGRLTLKPGRDADAAFLSRLEYAIRDAGYTPTNMEVMD